MDPEHFCFSAEQWPSFRAFRRSAGRQRLRGILPTSPRFLFFWARNALFHSLSCLGIRAGDSVLVPAYICTAAVQPIEAFGAKVTYYEVSRYCLPDLADLESKIDASTRAVLGVNYFGFPGAMRQLRGICDQRRLRLIEDCAHVLQGYEEGQALGTFGDASIFSWRKFFPIFDGGELILNRWESQPAVTWETEPLQFTLRVAKSLLERAIPRGPAQARRDRRNHSAPSSSAIPAAASSLENTSRSSPAEHRLHVYPNSSNFEEWMINFPMSRFSRLLLEHSSVEHIVSRRRANYLYLQDRFAQVPGVRPLYPDLLEGVCPWVFPVFFEGMPNAQFPLRKLGIPAASWCGVRHPGTVQPQFLASQFLYENLVFLPIHQNLAAKELDLLVKAAKAVRENQTSLAL
jgi:perosamine synthetase